MAGYKDFVRHLFGIKQTVNVSPTSEHQFRQQLAYENAELKGDIDKLKVVLARVQGTKDKQKEEEEIKMLLNEKKNQLEQVKGINYFSLGKLFERVYRDKKFANNLFFTDYQRGSKIDRFKDFGITSYGEFVAIGKNNNVLMKYPDLQHFFASIGALNNDVPRGIIPLCLDEDGRHQENVMAFDVPEVKREQDGRLKFYKTPKKPFYEVIADKNEIIRGLSHEVSDKEDFIVELEGQLDDSKRAVGIYETKNHSLSSQMSESQKSGTAMSNAFYNLTNELDVEKSKNSIIEDNLEIIEEELDEMRKKAERQGAQISDEKALETVLNIRKELIKDEPTKYLPPITENKPGKEVLT